MLPIEALAPDDDTLPVEVLTPSAISPTEDTSLAGSFLTYARLSGEARQVPSQAPSGGSAAVEETAMDIGLLLYRGDAALRRAEVLRSELLA